MQNNTQIVDVVNQFAKEIGVLMSLILTLEGRQRERKLKTTANEIDLPLKFLEKESQWANLTESYIGLLKPEFRYDVHKSDSPIVFWDYCAERRALINNNLTAKDLFEVEGSNVNAKILWRMATFLICVNMNYLNVLNIYILPLNSTPRNEIISIVWSGREPFQSIVSIQWILKDTI